jgi:NADH:ubiquinone oxidoreductase subunit F (NADH-binding)
MSLPILQGAREWPTVLLPGAVAEPGAPPAGGADGLAGLEAAERLGAWEAYRDAVSNLTPDAVISLVSESGLRGRGGGGFSTGSKWRHCASQPIRQRTVVANGFEADTGVQVDRALMERQPHAVVEGVAIAAWAVRADSAIIVVRAAAVEAAARLRDAIAAAETRGYIGPEASVTGRPLRIEVRPLSGSFVVGEETVLLRALEGRRAQPDQRPPYPSQQGLWGKPTVVNNVKTLAAVPWIVRHGAGAFASLGDGEAPGTTLVQLGGAVRKPGIVEAPLSATIREILDGPGGFVQGKLKAVLVGGPTGGFLPPEALDTPLGYGPLADAGALAGSGSLLALDTSTCLVDLATLMTRYLGDQACGKTIPCRIGTRRLAELGGAFCSGHMRPSDVGLIGDLAADLRAAALCGLEAGAPNPLISGMRYFAAEFDEHIERGHCPAGVCQPISLAGAAR